MPEPEMTDSRFYDSKWEEWDDMIYYSPAPRLRRSRIIRRLKKLPVRSLLDVGCGNGEFLQCVRRTNPGMELAGADISSSVIEKNRKRMPDADFYTLNLNSGAVASRFDAVVCMEVLEHCRDHQTAVNHLAAMTGKYLILSVPSGPVFEIDRRVGHTKHFNAGEIREMISASGLKVVAVECWGFPFFNLYKHMINMFPDKMSASFLSSQKYGFKQKCVSLVTYGLFQLCLPKGGYQLFALASR